MQQVADLDQRKIYRLRALDEQRLHLPASINFPGGPRG